MKKAILFAVIVTMAVPALSQAQGRSRDEQRRNQIRMIEGVLVQAVRLGAAEVSKEMQRFEPAGVTVLTGVPRARGFLLDGYGVFFDVEIPDMNQSVIWSMMNMQRDRQLGNAFDSLLAAHRHNARWTAASAGAGGASAGDQDRRAGGADARPAGPGAARTRTGRRCDGHDSPRSRQALFRSREERARRSDARLQRADGPRRGRVAHGRRARQRGPGAVSSGPVGAHHHRAPRQGQRPRRSITPTPPSATRFASA